MPIEFSDHVKEQLKKRQIPRNRVIETINNPEEIVPSFRNRRLRHKVFGDKLLRVITITEGSKITVVTSYYLRRK